MFNRGKIEQVGTGPQLYASPATRFVADFVGDSAFLSGQVQDMSSTVATLRFADGTVLPGLPLHGAGRPGGAADLMLRPERIDMSAQPGRAGASLAVTVEDVTFLGNSSTVSARTSWGEVLTVRLTFGHPMLGQVRRGDCLHVNWQAQDAHAFVRD